jgi:hypothetical protein
MKFIKGLARGEARERERERAKGVEEIECRGEDGGVLTEISLPRVIRRKSIDFRRKSFGFRREVERGEIGVEYFGDDVAECHVITFLDFRVS